MPDKIYKREHYLNKIRPFYTDDGLVKVITGIRRCGKSCLMLSIIDDLRASGIGDKDIIYLDLDKRDNRGIKTPDALEAAIAKATAGEGTKYLFIDEVQNVTGFEEVVNAYRSDGGFSIFITGSNSYLLSGELATKLTGRYIEVELFTLSFAEYLGMLSFLGKPTPDIGSAFDDYLTYGGFPKSLTYDDPQARATYIENVIGQIFEKDIKAHRKIRNRDTFERVMAYIINNFGATSSLSNIVDYFDNVEHLRIKRETLATYIELLINAKVIYKCPRFDLKSRKALRGQEKYYLADPGIYFARNTDTRINYGPALENILYIQLRALGYSVSVGRIGKLECDFIVRKRDEYAYIQVSMTIADRAVEEREYRPFLNIRDNFPQYLFTLEPLLQKRDGVRHLNLREFLQQDKELSEY